MKNKKGLSKILFSLCVLVIVYIYLCYKPQIDAMQEAKRQAQISVTEATFPDVVSLLGPDLEQKFMLLPVQHVSQLPELPTGCEITALTSLLNYYNYNVDKETMARDYLDKAKPLTASFTEYFIGSPWDNDGLGCFASVITKSANRFLSDNNSNMKAYDMTGASIKDLCTELEAGNPSIVWISRDFNKTSIPKEIRLNNGTTETWYSNEHCVVFTGYNLMDNTVTLVDPIYGIVKRDFNTFSARYLEFQSQAVVIK